jgi:hypothetical protein
VDRIISETRYMGLIAVVALAVAFLARVANWDGESNLLRLESPSPPSWSRSAPSAT